MGDEKKDGQQGFTVSDRRKRYEEPAAEQPAPPPPAATPAGEAADEAAGPAGEEHGHEPDAGGHDHPGAGPIGPAEFPQLVMKLAEEAIFFMGYHDDPKAGPPAANLPLASWHIEILEELRKKTKGNLTDPETKLIDEAVANLKVLFVRASGFLKH